MSLDVADLPLVGGHPALDLVNTVTPRVPVRGELPHDHLLDPAALLAWARRTDVVDDAEADAVEDAWRHEPAAGHTALSAAREIRDALHTTLLAATGIGPRDDAVTGPALERLHARWAASVGRSALVLGADPPVRVAVGLTAALLIPDRVADLALELLRTGELTRLRQCPPQAGGCGWLFLDRSRNGSRRWCRMADCGTEVKTRRLTERRRVIREQSYR